MVLLPALNPACFSAIISSAWGFSLFKMTFSMTFARMTDEADSSVVMAELQVALFRECNNQRLSPWDRPFSCSPDLCQNIYHGLPASWNKFCWYIINSGRFPLFQSCYCNLNFLEEDRLQIIFLGLAAVRYCIVSTTLIVVQF